MGLYVCRYTVPHFYHFSFVFIFLGCPQLYKYYAYRLPILRRRGKARGRTHLFILLDRSPAFSCLPFPLSLSLAQRRDLRMIFLYRGFPHFGAEYFSRGMSRRFFPTCLVTLLCVFLCFLSARNGLLSLS